MDISTSEQSILKTVSSDGTRRNTALRFIAVSGVGWLLDTLVYTTLVFFGLRIFIAGLLGGLCGAGFSFLVSSSLVFKNRGGRLSLKFIVYLGYSIAMILAGAAAAETVTGLLAHLRQLQELNIPLAAIAFFAKCLITPFLLATNFFVARHILQRV